MNLTSWAGLIQDVAQGMKVVPPNLNTEVYLNSMVLLQLLEATTGMGYCRICCQPSPGCLCLGAYQQAPTETLSQVMDRISGQGVAASTGGPTTPGTAPTELQEQGAPSPPPGFPPPEFTNWSLPPPKLPSTGRLPAPSGGPPGSGGQTVGPQAPGPWVLGQRALAPPMSAPSTPHGTRLSVSLGHATLLLCTSRGCNHRVSLLLCTSRWCSHQGGQRGGEQQLDSPPTELLLQPVKLSLTTEDCQPGDRVAEAGQPAAPGVCRRWQQMLPLLPPWERLDLDQADEQSPGAMTRPC